MAEHCHPRLRVKEEPSQDQENIVTPLVKHPHEGRQKSTLVDKVEEVEDFDNDPFLSGKPFFNIIISKSHVAPRYHIVIPIRIYRKLPRAMVPAVLRYNSKNWNTFYVGNCKCPRLDSGWKKFAKDNNLTLGDACVFEVMESSKTKIKFKVHILRRELPPELIEAIDSHGTSGNPIVLN